MRALVSYDRYTELLSKHILRTITPAETADVAYFEAAHQLPERKFCPKCNAPVWTFLTPYRVCHDIAKCPGKPVTTS
jgi:hypothetical protein